MGKQMSSQTHRAVCLPTPPALPICSVYPCGFNFSRYWPTLAIREEKIFSNAPVPQCKVYVPCGKQHSTWLLECSTVKKSVWDLVLRFKDAKTSLRRAGWNTQVLRPSDARAFVMKTQCVLAPRTDTEDHEAAQTDTSKDKLPSDRRPGQTLMSLDASVIPPWMSRAETLTCDSAHRPQRAVRRLEKRSEDHMQSFHICRFLTKKKSLPPGMILQPSMMKSSSQNLCRSSFTKMQIWQVLP